jgi:sugar phosphate isomerase/epimerase
VEERSSRDPDNMRLPLHSAPDRLQSSDPLNTFQKLLPMKLSLSVRIVEAPCKTKLFVPFEELVSIAKDTGYQAICLRASAGGVETPPSRLTEMRRCVEAAGLFISMVTADFNVPLNNDRGPDSLRNIAPSLDVAATVGCSLVRVCLKHRDDIPFARQAAERAAERGIRLAHQCHTTSLFEEVEPMLHVLAEIGQPNFGLIYEPANLLLNGQSYGLDTILKIRPYLMNVYVQNHCLKTDGNEELPTFCRGNVRFDHLAPWAPGGVDFLAVTGALRQIGYDGTFTVHQAQGIRSATDARLFAKRCADYFKPLLRQDASNA